MNIDWSRVAEPQEDHHDEAAVRFMAQQQGWEGYEPTEFEIEPLPAPFTSEQFQPLDVDGMEVAEMLAVLKLWPLGYSSATGVVDRFYPMTCPGYGWKRGRGCASGHQTPDRDPRFPYLVTYATINCPLGGAEGFVHEAGHCRLWSLGMRVEDHDGFLITNGDSSSDELYDSPIRKDIPRPMCACIHAQYSYIWCSALDVEVFHNARDDEERERAVLYLEANVPRIAPAQDMIRENVRCTEVGQAFMGGLLDWGERVITEGQRIMDEAA